MQVKVTGTEEKRKGLQFTSYGWAIWAASTDHLHLPYCNIVTISAKMQVQ